LSLSKRLMCSSSSRMTLLRVASFITVSRPSLRVQRTRGDLAQLGLVSYRTPARPTVQPGSPQGRDQANVFDFIFNRFYPGKHPQACSPLGYLTSLRSGLRISDVLQGWKLGGVLPGGHVVLMLPGQH
jgi:hypothetical protein